MANIGRYGLGELEYGLFGDQGTTDPGGGELGSGRNWLAWQLPVGHENGPSWA